jgi:hypothetical protein
MVMRFGSMIDVNKLISFFSRIRPIWLKELFFSKSLAVVFCGIRLKSIVHQVRLAVFLVSGVEKQSGEMVQLLFVGTGSFPEFLGNRIFKEKPVVKQCDTVFIWKIKDVKNKYANSVDSVMLSCDRFFQRFLFKEDMLVFPSMVEMVLDTSKPVECLFDKKHITHSAYTDIKKAKKGNFSFEITNDIEKIQFFYDSMFLPMVYTRHKEELAYVPPFLFFKFLREAGYKLFLVYDEKGNPVSGVLFLETGNELFNRYAGIYQGDEGLLKKGATAARYYFSIRYVKEKGIDRFNFGAAEPFFHNGVFKYKQKWGMNAVQTKRTFFPNVFGIYLYPDCKSLRSFLLENPFIGISERNDLVGYVFVDRALSIGEKKEVEERFDVSGLQEFRFVEL